MDFMIFINFDELFGIFMNFGHGSLKNLAKPCTMVKVRPAAPREIFARCQAGLLSFEDFHRSSSWFGGESDREIVSCRAVRAVLACVRACARSGCLVELHRKIGCFPFTFSLFALLACPFSLFGLVSFPFSLV